MKSRFSKLCDFSFYLTVFVILWGALVRITHSGAGCGRHWPLCDGQVIPLAPSTEMLIEFTHRVTSGASAIFVFALYFIAKKTSADKSLHKAALFATIFMGIEVLLGASLVLFAWVKDNSSSTRATVMGLHLVNSFLLIASLYLVKLLKDKKLRVKRPNGPEILLLIGFLLIASMGAITSLGDTIFPVTEVGGGVANSFADGSHFLIQLRIVHPILAILISFFLLRYAIGESMHSSKKSLSIRLIGLIVLQVIIGASTILLLAPSVLQLTHLLIALGIWCTLVALVATGDSSEHIV